MIVSSRLLCSALAIIFSAFVVLGASDIDSFGVAKGFGYVQTGQSAPVAVAKPWYFQAFAEGRAQGAISQATVRLPNGFIRPLDALEISYPDGIRYGFVHHKSVASKGDIDQEFAPGAYAFTIRGPLGSKTASISLPSDRYPNAPTIVNWSNLQAVESSFPTVIRWAPMAGGTASDHIALEISTGDHIFYASPDLDEQGRLTGTATSVTIPAGTLPAGQTFYGALVFMKLTGRNSTAIPGALGEASYFAATGFQISTLSAAPAQGRFQFASTSYSQSENQEVAQIKVTRAGTSGRAHVTLRPLGGTAIAGQDYVGGSKRVVFEDGMSSTNVPIDLIKDFRVDGNKTVNLTLSAPSSGSVVGPRNKAVLTIRDGELASAGTIRFASTTVFALEHSKVARVTLLRTGGTQGRVGVNYVVSGPAAMQKVDFNPKSGFVEFGPGETMKTIGIGLIDDFLDETNETFFVSLKTATGGASLGPRKATVTILDNDSGGVIRFDTNLVTLSSSEASAYLLLRRSGGKADNVVVQYRVVPTVGFPSEYLQLSGEARFEAGHTNAYLNIPIYRDILAQGAEFALELTDVSGGGKLGSRTNAFVQIEPIGEGTPTDELPPGSSGAMH